MTSQEERALWEAPPPHPMWWQAISRGARDGMPFADVAAQLTAANRGADDTVPGLGPLEQVDDDLPPLRRDDVLWLIGKLLELEGDTGRDGVGIHVLQWLALVHHYAAEREPFDALRQLARAEVIREATLSEHGVGFSGSQLRWPLITTTDTIAAIDEAEVRLGFPAFAAPKRQATTISGSRPRLRRPGWFRRVLGFGAGDLRNL